MVKKKKCKACGFKFRLEKGNRYLARESALLIGNLEMFYCPQCEFQNAVGTYEKPIEEDINSNEKWQEVSEKEYSEFKK